MFRCLAPLARAGVLLLVASIAVPAVAQNVYRWTDDEGKVHYTPALPAEAADKPYDILSPSGVVIERVTQPETTAPPPVEPVDKKPIPLYTERERQQISERLLMLRYRNEAQIDEAMQLELDQLKYDFHLLDNEYASMIKSLQQQVHAAANRQRAGLEVDPSQLEQIDVLRGRMSANRVRVGELEQHQDVIREQFARELERFREIRDRNKPQPHPTG
ncbi:DUF4124 domain-containing protein [Marinihelvus fidelis]|uniref:DUF4124 domain-containing protein n=1 Tax=Marinihelvus fidelis TaxID=2613842 RepID=UPI00177C8FD4|nr:DUF4124 domain-containing protein [Marinihelvus fidelis]